MMASAARRMKAVLWWTWVCFDVGSGYVGSMGLMEMLVFLMHVPRAQVQRVNGRVELLFFFFVCVSVYVSQIVNHGRNTLANNPTTPNQ